MGVPYLSSTVSSVVLSVELCGGAGVNEGEQGRQRSTVQWTVSPRASLFVHVHVSIYCDIVCQEVSQKHKSTNQIQNPSTNLITRCIAQACLSCVTVPSRSNVVLPMCRPPRPPCGRRLIEKHNFRHF